jgi:tetratricopeptide (TPR) repeat protein
MDELVDALVPGMPPAARAAVISQAQGLPLFAVETVRSLIDRDVVQPVEGIYRLTGDVGELAVPDSLHSLLAARLDALDPGVRRLVSDAAVLGTTFPAEALIAVSGQDESSVRAALADLVRREVLSVSADPLSPERGSYQFAQQMLRQVAYDTLSRKDRKARHLRVAAHLRAVFAGDGEEVADVIARHYLDALNAIPDDPDAAGIRGQAVAALIRAGERAERTGAPARAATSFAAAADLITADQNAGEPAAGTLWERAAEAAIRDGDYATAVDDAGKARTDYLRRGQDRTAARAQAIAGRALRHWGRHTEARDQLTEAVEVLRADADTDTVRALEEFAVVAVFAGSPDADRLTTEALGLGQALDVSVGQLSGLLLSRGIYLGTASRRTQAIAYLRESARLAAQAEDNVAVGRVLLNVSDVLAVTDPAAAAEAARTAVGHLRRVGLRIHLTYAIANLAEALVQLGDWGAAETEFDQAVSSYGLADIEHLIVQRGWLAALRGDVETAETTLAALTDTRVSEDPQDQALVSVAEAFTAAARGQPENALRHARAALPYADALGISSESMRWAWPLAARAAHELGDTAAVGELIALLDSHQPGHLAPVLRAERELARARLAGADLAAAITGLRERSTPFHLAHGLIDQAEYLTRHGDAAAAAPAIDEARDIGRRLRCQPLLDRADALERAQPRVRA